MMGIWVEPESIFQYENIYRPRHTVPSIISLTPRSGNLPSAVSHFLAGATLALPFTGVLSIREAVRPVGLMFSASLLAAAPDLDTIFFGLIPYGHFFGHRGFFHSPFKSTRAGRKNRNKSVKALRRRRMSPLLKLSRTGKKEKASGSNDARQFSSSAAGDRAPIVPKRG
jgi:hypothetical protein